METQFSQEFEDGIFIGRLLDQCAAIGETLEDVYKTVKASANFEGEWRDRPKLPDSYKEINVFTVAAWNNDKFDNVRSREDAVKRYLAVLEARKEKAKAICDKLVSAVACFEPSEIDLVYQSIMHMPVTFTHSMVAEVLIEMGKPFKHAPVADDVPESLVSQELSSAMVELVRSLDTDAAMLAAARSM